MDQDVLYFFDGKPKALNWAAVFQAAVRAKSGALANGFI